MRQVFRCSRRRRAAPARRRQFPPRPKKPGSRAINHRAGSRRLRPPPRTPDAGPNQTSGDVGHRLLDGVAGSCRARGAPSRCDLVRRRGRRRSRPARCLDVPRAQASAALASSGPATTRSGSRCSTGIAASALAICCSVACEQLPARQAAEPPTAASEAASAPCDLTLPEATSARARPRPIPDAPTDRR